MRLVWVLLVGCAHDTTSTTRDPAPAPAIDAAVAPAFAPTLDATFGRDPACERACGRYRTCLGAMWTANHERTCLEDCWNSHGYRQAASFDATHFADCLEALSCQAIKDSMTMNEGPAGYCYSTALH